MAKSKAYRCTSGHLVTFNCLPPGDGWDGLLSFNAQDVLTVGDRQYCALCLQERLDLLGVGRVLPPHEKMVDTSPDGRPS